MIKTPLVRYKKVPINGTFLHWSSSLDIIRTFIDDDIIAIEAVKEMLNKEKEL